METGAKFSPCRRFRYLLWRRWNEDRPWCNFIGLNPSTADEAQDDPTVRRCINYAKDWGYGGLYMTNIFAYRATDPQEMKVQPDPVGPDNDRAIQQAWLDAEISVAGWGTHGSYQNREAEVLLLITSLYCLAVTKDGHPCHPLYLPKTLKPVLWADRPPPLEEALMRFMESPGCDLCLWPIGR